MMKVKFHRTVQNTTYYTHRKLNTSRDTLSSHEPIVYTHGLTDLCTYALRIMGSHYF